MSVRLARMRLLGCVLGLLGSAVAAGSVPQQSLPDRGLAAEAAEQWDTALGVYREILEQTPRRPDLWLRIADIEARLGHAEAAAAATSEAARAAPQDAEVQYRLAQAWSVAGRPEPALAAAERALALAPDNPEYLLGHAQLASWTGRYDLSRASYQRVHAPPPRAVPAATGATAAAEIAAVDLPPAIVQPPEDPGRGRDGGAPPGAMAPLPGRIFELQLALFHHRQKAQSFVEEVRREGHRPYVVEVLSSKGEVRYTVRIGPYASMDEAVARASEIRQQEDRATVIRYRSQPVDRP